MANLELIANEATARPFIPTRERPHPRMRPRGVYLADWFDASGNPIIQAIATNGRVISWLPWLEGLSFDRLTSELWRLLDVQDPIGPRILR